MRVSLNNLNPLTLSHYPIQMENPNLINLTDEPPFNESLWIGTGRKYPKNPIEVPFELANHCDDLLEIPSDSAVFFPQDDITVEEFLNWNLPGPMPWFLSNLIAVSAHSFQIRTLLALCLSQFYGFVLVDQQIMVAQASGYWNSQVKGR